MRRPGRQWVWERSFSWAFHPQTLSGVHLALALSSEAWHLIDQLEGPSFLALTPPVVGDSQASLGAHSVPGRAGSGAQENLPARVDSEVSLRAFAMSATPIHQSTDPPIRRSADPPIHRSADPPIHRSTDPQIHRSADPPTRASMPPPLGRPAARAESLLLSPGITAGPGARPGSQQGTPPCVPPRGADTDTRAAHADLPARGCSLTSPRRAEGGPPKVQRVTEHWAAQDGNEGFQWRREKGGARDKCGVSSPWTPCSGISLLFQNLCKAGVSVAK